MENNNDITILNGRIETLKLKYKFDIIILNQVIEHLENIGGVLKKCYQILWTKASNSKLFS